MSDALLDRYAAVERLYSQGQWDAVLQASDALLAELPPEPGDPWRARLQLLQGHTHLYGLAQFDRAASIYQRVLGERPEPVLQSVAEQELARCQQALAAMDATPPTPATTESPPAPAAAPIAQAPLSQPSTISQPSPLSQEFPFTAKAMGNPPPGQAVSAMPWLETAGSSNQGEQAAAATASALAPEPEPDEPAPVAVAAMGTAPSEPETEPEPASVAAPAAEATPEAGPELQPQAAAEAPVRENDLSDVIDEPDQIEVRQADPRSAELIDLELIDLKPINLEPIEPVQAPASATQDQDRRWSAAEEAELARGLLTVVLG